MAGRGKASGGRARGERASELEGQVVRVGRRGAAGSLGDRWRGAAGSAAEQQRGRGERGSRRELVHNFSKVQGVHCKVRFSFKPYPK
jgi:hypothetical protein